METAGHTLTSRLLVCLMLVWNTPATAPAQAVAAEHNLRVCADPNNLPFSDKRLQGFENRLAAFVAAKLGMKGVKYTWHAQRRGFLRNTLNSFKCDLVMGIPKLDMVATTRPYYASSYVFVSRKDAGLTFSSIKAPELRHLRIGVMLIGDDGANTPPAHVLGEEGIVDNVVGYTIYGDYREESPPSRVIRDVALGKIDIAAVWGPLAGYYAKHSQVPLRLTPITDTVDYLPLVFHYSISMGVRRGDEQLRNKLDQIIVTNKRQIDAILDEFGVPRD